MVQNYDDQNIFAKILRGEIPSHKVYEDAHTLVIMDVMPRTTGHCLVLPKQAARNILDVSDDSLAHIAKITQKLAKAAITAFGADGITIQQNNESAGDQVIFHLHVHVMPRFEGQTLGAAASTMENNDTLATNASKLRSALEQQIQ